MDLVEARLKMGRLASAVADLEFPERQFPTHALEAGGLALRVSTRLEPGAWSGPAAERAFAGYQVVTRDIPGTPRSLGDVGWLYNTDERLERVARWGGETAADLRWRMSVLGCDGIGFSTGGFEIATFVFPDAVAAGRAAAIDGKAVEAIVGRDHPVLPGGENLWGEDVKDMSAWLEQTAARAYDARYAASILNRLGPEGVTQAIDLAVAGGPEDRERLFDLIGAASRGGYLDPEVEAAILRSPHLDLLAGSDARYSDAFATAVAEALLDPHRPGAERFPMVPGPPPGDVEAAHSLLARYDIGSGLDPGTLTGLTGNIYLPADLVADIVALAVGAHSTNDASRKVLDAVLLDVGRGNPCSDESKRVLAAMAAERMKPALRGGVGRGAVKEVGAGHVEHGPFEHPV